MNLGLRSPKRARYQLSLLHNSGKNQHTNVKQVSKYNPLLPPSAISVIAATSEEHENYNDYQNGCHSFLQIYIGDLAYFIWVRKNYITSLGIYLVLPMAFGWLSDVVLTTAFWLGWFFVRAP